MAQIQSKAARGDKKAVGKGWIMHKIKLSTLKPNPDNPREYTCLTCGKIFYSKKGCKSRMPKYCNSICYGESLKLHIKCKLCGNEIENKHSVSIKNRIYCSNKCKIESTKGRKLSEKWKKALSDGRKKSIKCKGENLYNWKGGKSTKKIRQKQSFYKRKRSLKLNMPIDVLNKILEQQKNQCFYCEKPLNNYKAIEHLTPVSRGGDNEFYNLVYACQKCNSQKRQNTLEEFAAKKNRFDWLDKWEKILVEVL
jgi:5-methylcytosine-specific restriction endonuclease McrA